MYMKLNYPRTIFVGFAFFLICAFWQAYEVSCVTIVDFIVDRGVNPRRICTLATTR